MPRRCGIQLSIERAIRWQHEEVSVRRVRYTVAASLDGYIAGPKGEFDWIPMDPDIDFRALFDQFDTILMGRRTFEGLKGGDGGGMPKMKTFVFSRTLRQGDHPDVTIVSEKPREAMAALPSAPGKDIWLFGGGLLFRSLAELGLVDTVEVAVVPVLLGGGLPLFPPPATQVKLALTGHRVYQRSGIVSLEYTVKPVAARSARR
jgi:dihydrofolate reductase